MSTYASPRPITSSDLVSEFESGEPSLDDWPRKQALTNRASGASRCFVVGRGAPVLGYYALSSGAVQRGGVSHRIGHGMPQQIPVILLGRLAVDVKEQAQGLGSHLLRDAITRTVAAADVIGVRALLVHALHERARDFYLHFGFEPTPTDPLHLLLLIKDARAALR